MRPEIELLLQCASSLFAPEPEYGWKGFPGGAVDWPCFLDMVRFHRAVFPAFRFLAGAARDLAPASVVEDLRRVHLSILASNLRAARELVEVAAVLEKAGCPVVFYKGPLLAVSAYGDLGGRQFTDLDLFLRTDDLGPAGRELVRLGYRPPDGARRTFTGLTLSLQRDAVFLGDKGRLPLEVQWRIAQRYHPVFPKPAELWSRCRRTKFEGAELLTFSPEDTLLVLCLHGLYHAWGILQMVTDVAAVVRNLRPDWTQTLDLARENRAERILFLGLLLARRMLGTDLPGWLLDKARSDRVAVAAAQDSVSRFFQLENWEDKARRFFFREAGLFPGLGAQARYVLGRLTTPNEEDLAGKPLTWGRLAALPLLRMARLFRKYFL